MQSMTTNDDSKKIAALSSLALLKEDIDSSKRDYIDYLRAFTEHAIAKQSVDPINSETAGEALQSEFGLNLPTKVIELVLQRMARNGDLIKNKGLYSISPGKISEHKSFDLRRKTTNEHVEEIIREFKNFANNHDLDPKREDIINALLSFLSKFAISYLRAYLLKTALPESPPANDKTQTLLADFINRSYATDKKSFEQLITLVKGQMYANALLCPDLEGIKKDFTRTKFFLDTPLVLNLLGHHGYQQEQSSKELVERLIKLGGKVFLFSHTLQEVASVIKNASEWVDRPDGRGNVIFNARRKKLSRSDLIIKSSNVESDLLSMGISIANNPEYEDKYQISEIEFQDTLEDRIEYFNEMAMRADVESVRSIYCLRGKTVPMRLEDALAVVVTTNSAYARAAYEFGKSQNSTREVSPVITDFSLANIAWLKSPMEWESAAEIETLAACYAALEPRSSDWNNYLKRIDELESSGKINPDEHALLRITPISRIDALNLTDDIHDPALIGGSVREILDRISNQLTEPTRNELKAAHRDRDNAKTESEAHKALKEKEEGALKALVGWIANTVTFILIIAPLSILIIFGSSASSGLLAKFGITVDNSNIAYLAATTIVAIGTISTIFGFSFRGVIGNFKKAISSRILSAIYSRVK